MILDRKPLTIKRLLDDKVRKIAEKGPKMSNVELYNLCLLNKERDEIAEEEKSNNHIERST